ncbi:MULTISPECIES: DUF559 domain-containing protein [unclassified Corynebacterium]|uniref:DUF559 domain-containing protein n=1 Tax=unclassified Corynebacterium TaxID=2624378 RepID=UPI0021AA4C7F|nr:MULTISPECIES: DUF559 domain-containing protein [unclassified Corynebacterium]MCT1451993.1 DUF559 domain-containing protein [Corynebacterium sp. p3-SID1145]MCT1461032.1 DUF559 domain-containing protein [Corynebacterium sp. p3-SID1140]MDN8594998.1 DUF559 domain-containing protein [Corynebacterium sp. P4_F2]WKK54787.1 DUF559 domain-containing protein [Corynebacterium sp. P4-C1]WKK64164.1 DUF559 domain-containing protein [Corynebacterium sp. P8-C1]
MGVDKENQDELKKWEMRKGELREGIVDRRKNAAREDLHGDFEELAALIHYPRELWEELKYHEQQWLRVEAAAMVSTTAILTGRSAARKLGIWVVASTEEKVEVSLPSRGVSRSRKASGNYEFRHSHIQPSDVVMYEGHPVTRPIRTFIDIARHHGFLEGLIAADYLLRRGIERSEILRGIQRMGRAKGMKIARRCLEHAIPDADSPYESLARGLLIEAGIEPVQAQYKIGAYYVDLLIGSWLVIEIDGGKKYSGPDAEKVRQSEFNRQKFIGNRGYVFLRYAPWFVRKHPDRFLAEVRQTLAASGLIRERLAQ